MDTLPSNWRMVDFYTLVKEKPNFNLGKVQQKDIKKEGKYPVVDQGQDFISGYSNIEDFVYDGELPVVIFGDHTLAVKYIDFKFIQGADGIKVLRPNTNIDAKFLYYLIEKYKPEDKKYARHFKKLRDIKYPVPFKNGQPDLEEQRHIADKLGETISLQKKIKSEVEITETLFSSICRKEFEKINSNSEYKKLADTCNIIKGKFPTLKTSGGEYTFVVTAEKRKSANDYQFDGEAVCIPLVSSTGHGKASLHRIHYEEGKFALANIMVAIMPKNKQKVIAKYLYYYLSFYRNSLLVPLMRGAANVTIPLGEIGSVNVPIPSIREQRKLISVLTEVEKLEKNFLYSQGLSAQLFQSAMDYAFKGKLVTVIEPVPVKLNYFPIQQALASILKRFERG